MENKLIGETGAVTGFETPDPKDAHQGQYTTTPANSQVSSSNQMEYAGVELPDPKEVTGQFDHLATRDPMAMAHAAQAPERIGAQDTATLAATSALLDAAVPMSGVDINASTLVAREQQTRAADPNPGYVPPSERAPAHQSAAEFAAAEGAPALAQGEHTPGRKL